MTTYVCVCVYVCETVGTLNPGHKYFQVDPMEFQMIIRWLVINRGLPILCPFSSAFLCSFGEFFSQKLQETNLQRTRIYRNHLHQQEIPVKTLLAGYSPKQVTTYSRSKPNRLVPTGKKHDFNSINYVYWVLFKQQIMLKILNKRLL